MSKKKQDMNIVMEWTEIKIKDATKDFPTRSEVTRDIERAKSEMSKIFVSWSGLIKVVISLVGLLLGYLTYFSKT